MKKTNMKNMIDRELMHIELSDKVKAGIRSQAAHETPKKTWKRISVSAAASVAVVILGGTTVLAGHYMLNRVHVNEEALPELDSMQIVKLNEIEAEPDENEEIRKDYSDYGTMADALGIKLLDTELSGDNPYMLCRIRTNTTDFAIITVDNFIIGDTDNYRFLEEENRYAYDNGTEYFTPVSLNIDLILSKTQLETGWDTDYLGMYRFVESYTSRQGYVVNIIEDTIEEDLEDYVSEKVAVFVADGVRYSLKGRVSVDTMKNIIDTMR